MVGYILMVPLDIWNVKAIGASINLATSLGVSPEECNHMDLAPEG